MGIPHLSTILEPYAVSSFLENDCVVIDGPALAYHALHVCRSNGVIQPPYRLLGKTTIEWLDQLLSHNISIKKIYFDGYLPKSKLETRLGRMTRNNSQLNKLHSSTANGCPADLLLADPDVSTVALSKSSALRRRIPIDPCFLVPAVIDQLRDCARYGSLVQIVPGEADIFCANHLQRHGGIVITSDSDLLAHDLGHGRVVFFRDIHEDKCSSKLKSLSYSPRKICLALGLKYPSEGTRLAYELKISPQATLAQVVKKCHGLATDPGNYSEFCRQYLPLDDSASEVATNPFALTLDRLDPRVSELLLQLNSSHGSDFGEVCVNMFLPLLVESPKRASAWEQSFSIRQLAYSIANSANRNDEPCVREYRKVQNTSQRGRRVSLLSEEQKQDCVDHILACANIVNRICNPIDDTYWVYFSITFGLIECCRHGMHSLVSEAVQRNWDGAGAKSKAPEQFEWDLVHILAQLHGTLYSLRVLEQVLSSLRETLLAPELKRFDRLHCLLLQPLPLNRYPLVDEVCHILDTVRQQQLIALIQNKYLDVAQEQTSGRDSLHSSGIQPAAVNAPNFGEVQESTESIELAATNPFSLLPLE